MKDRNPGRKSTNENWDTRRDLFDVFTQRVFPKTYSSAQIERLARLKIDGEELSRKETVVFAAKVLAHRHWPKKVEARINQTLGVLTEDERRVAELALGTSYCGDALNKDQIAQQLNLSPERVDVFVAASLEKINPDNKS